MTNLADIPRAYQKTATIKPFPLANANCGPMAVNVRPAMVEVETLVPVLEGLAIARERDRELAQRIARLVQAPGTEQPEAASESLEYRIMSWLANAVTIAGIVLLIILAASLLADLPGLLARGIAS